MKKKTITKEHPLTAFRKANEARNAMVKKSITKYQSKGEVQEGKSVRDSVSDMNTMHPNFTYDTSRPQVFRKPVRPIVPKKPQTGKGSGMGRMYMDDMSNPLSEQKKGGPVKYKTGGAAKTTKFAALAKPFNKATAADRIAGAKKNASKKK